MAECKYYKLVRQVSYDSGVTWISLDEYQKGDLYENDSPDCGGGITQYRWVNVSGEYTCVGTTKYQKTKKQQSTDGGQTWTDVNPPEYSTGAVIERDSSDCGGGSGYENQYLTLVARESGRFKISGATSEAWPNTVYYSLDSGATWNTISYNSYSPTVQSGQKIMWKTQLGSTRGWRTFISSGRFDVEGNAMSLVYGDNFRGQTSLSGKDMVFYGLFSGSSVVDAENLILPATTLAEGCYTNMFYNCTSLTSIPSDLLPATTLLAGCYNAMFSHCTSLTTLPSNLLPATTLAYMCYFAMFSNCTALASVPNLPATTLAEECYYGMFNRCTSLASVPSNLLPATTLADSCYMDMFNSCTSLTTAPILPATTLVYRCYTDMFEGCTRLNYIKCLATDISAEDCTYTWVYGVSSSGTFVKNSSMSGWPSGMSGIPTNWTVQNA